MKNFIFIFVGLLAAASCLSQTVPGQDFNDYVVSMMKSYPTDGTHQYYWPSSGGWSGNTRDLYYRGALFAKGDSFGRCYCCGLTFEVFFRAYEAYCKAKGWPFVINNFDSSALSKFKGQWFGSDGNRKTLLNAIVSNNLGRGISFEQAKLGDFVQLWRNNGSGHSVIFVEWVKNGQTITGVKYWSTQSSTNGIGYRIEYFGGSSGMDPNQFYIARVGK